MPLNLLDILSNPILYSTIFDHLEPQDVLRLFQTCRTIYAFKGDLWNINRSLRRFVNDPIAFRSLMARYDAIVSGSHALQFLARVKWTKSDLDVYITKEEGTIEFAKHLMEHEGYYFKPYEWQSPDVITAITERSAEKGRWVEAMMNREPEDQPVVDDDNLSELGVYMLRGITGVFNFIHKSYEGRRIQLIVASVTPLFGILAGYYATHIFNFFTWNKAYSLFPYHTFCEKQAFYTQHLSRQSGEAVEKYIERGYEFLDYGKVHKCIKNCPFRPHRRVGDRFSWVLDLDIEGIDSSLASAPQNVMDYQTWGMKMHNSYWDRIDATRVFSATGYVDIRIVWDSTSFRYPRICDCQTNTWGDYVESMKKTMGRLAGYNITFPESKSKDWADGDRKYYFDDEFENWYKHWEESIMPYENMWRFQYPMLGGFEADVTYGGKNCETPLDEMEDVKHRNEEE
ncbi:hypothetical protein AA313_de0208738 [Arthrobotrys entomopaga]|nr:hypothetical protein AA313_de0208738 [Arthrobotrys entomopaga]